MPDLSQSHTLDNASTSVVKGELIPIHAACRLQADILPDFLSCSSS